MVGFGPDWNPWTLAARAEAAQVLAVRKCLANKEYATRAGLPEPLGTIDDAKLNPQGGSIALGHPVGASGAFIVTKLLHELIRVNGRYGMATMCIGGGQGITTIWERL